MFQDPICLAPFIGVLVDVNKKVRPCCVYDDLVDGYPGDLRTETISEIRNNKKWIEIKQNLSDQKLVGGCELCAIREARTGWSLRQDYTRTGGHRIEDWEDNKIQMIEFNGSNICNLACMHCSPKFSSTWVPLSRKMIKIKALGYELGPDDIVTKADPNLITKNLEELDLSKLKFIVLKGGEPLLNEETEQVLQYLLDKDILPKIVVHVTTNGTTIDPKILHLLSRAKIVEVLVSVDGNEKLNPYIRWSRKNFATLERIEQGIAILACFPNVQLTLTTSVMSYNIFRLVEIRDWWLKIKEQYPKNIYFSKNSFENVVTTDRVSLRNLSETTRLNLANFYEQAQSDLREFDAVIKELRREPLDKFYHNQWVDYTLGLDKLRGTSILDAEPRLVNDLVEWN